MGNDLSSASSSVDLSRTGQSSSSRRYAEVQPSLLEFGFLARGGSRVLQLTIVNNHTTPLSWKADTGGASWLTLKDHGFKPVQPDRQHVINVKADAASLEEGTYLTTIDVTLMDSVTIHIPVSIEVIKTLFSTQNHIPPKSPTITTGTSAAVSSVSSASQPSLSISVAEGRRASALVTISNPNAEPINWDATSKVRWLILSPSLSGKLQKNQTPGDSQKIEVIVDANTLSKGTYSAILSFTSGDSFIPSKDNPNSPTDLTVHVTVN